MKSRTKVFTAIIGLLAILTIILASTPTYASPQASTTPLSSGPHILQASATNSTSTTTSTNTTAAAPFYAFITTPIVAWVQIALTPIIGNPPQIPPSTFLTVGLATMMALISSTCAKLLVDYDMVRSTMKEVQAWQKELNAAKKANDEQTVAKLMKKSQAMMKQQSRASMEQMKVTAVTFVPFLLVWYLFNAVLGHNPVAYAPFPLPVVGTTLTFFAWYFLCSLSVNLPLMRIFGIGMSDN